MNPILKVLLKSCTIKKPVQTVTIALNTTYCTELYRTNFEKEIKKYSHENPASLYK